MMASSATAFDTAALTAAARAAGHALPNGWQPIPERIPSSLEDSDLSTRPAIKRMAQLVSESLTDQKIQELGKRTSGLWGTGTPQQICWDVYWYAKHSIKFLVDE